MLTLTLLLLLLPLAVHAHDNGMDMSMDGAMSLTSGHGMLPFLHFTPGDTLFFEGWVPTSPGAIFGACIGLFLLAIAERWVAVVRRGAEGVWGRRAQIALSNKLTSQASKAKSQSQSQSDDIKPHSSSSSSSKTSILSTATVPPFIPSQDILRGVLHMVQVAFGFLFMLAVMTYQVAFIISIVLGSGVGEMLFGRYMATPGGGAGMSH